MPFVIHRAPATPTSRPPLLFVHGGYVDSRCWDAHFLPFFAQRGYHCYALDLSGHGCSAAGGDIDRQGLEDYLGDVLCVLARLPARPVIIGHSLGAYLAERVLERSLAVAGVLVSPVPPAGTLESAIGLLARQPAFFSQVARISQGELDRHGLRVIRDVYFAPTTSLETVVDFAHFVQPESGRALRELALLACRWLPPAPALPVLVSSGEFDAVFPPYMARRVARRWRAELQIIDGAGHALILDQQWRACAARMLGWLERLEPLPAAGRHDGAGLRCPA